MKSTNSWLIPFVKRTILPLYLFISITSFFEGVFKLKFFASKTPKHEVFLKINFPLCLGAFRANLSGLSD